MLPKSNFVSLRDRLQQLQEAHSKLCLEWAAICLELSKHGMVFPLADSIDAIDHELGRVNKIALSLPPTGDDEQFMPRYCGSLHGHATEITLKGDRL